MNTKYIQHICSPSPSSYALPILTDTHPWTGPVLLSCPSLFNCILRAQGGGCHGISDLYTLYFNQISPLLILSLRPAPLLFKSSVNCILLSAYSDAMFQYFSLQNSPSLSHLLIVTSDRPTITIICSLSLSLYVCVYMCICTFIL
jgi:hypothetical protein